MRKRNHAEKGSGRELGHLTTNAFLFLSFSLSLSLFFVFFFFFFFFWQIPDYFVWWGNEKKLRRLFILDLVFSREGAEVFNLIFYLLLFLLLSLQRVSC